MLENPNYQVIKIAKSKPNQVRLIKPSKKRHILRNIFFTLLF